MYNFSSCFMYIKQRELKGTHQKGMWLKVVDAASAVGACLILGEANILTVRQGRWYLTYVLCGDGCCCDFYLFNFSLEKCFLTSHYTLIFYSLCSTMTTFRYQVHIHLKFLIIRYSRYQATKLVVAHLVYLNSRNTILLQIR